MFSLRIRSFFNKEFSSEPMAAGAGRSAQHRTELAEWQDELAEMEASLQKLEEEKEELKRQLRRSDEAAKRSILLGLLYGYFTEESPGQSLLPCGIAFDGQKIFRVVLFRTEGKSAEEREEPSVFSALRDYIAKQQKAAEIVGLSAAETAVILCDDAETEGVLREQLSVMQSEIERQTGQQIAVCCGTAENDLIGISRSFQSARAWLDGKSPGDAEQQVLIAAVGRGENYYYPTDWEIQLINALKVENEETALKVVCGLQAENTARDLSPEMKIRVTSLIFETITRVIVELGMDAAVPRQDFAENLKTYSDKRQWQYLYTLVQNVCRRSLCLDAGRQAGNVGRKMLVYVDQNYRDCALSLKDLSSEFNLSVSAVSRVFKAAANICFYDYLCRIRMEKAKEVLRRPEKTSVAETAKLVGYENDLSFRRAFQRYEGITPREYMTKYEIPQKKSEFETKYS